MGFHFSKRIKILPGVRINLGLKGASLSLGGKGATLNIGKRGVHATASIPGTGLSYRERLDRPTKAAHRQEPAPVALPDYFELQFDSRGLHFLDAGGQTLPGPVVARLRETKMEQVQEYLEALAAANDAAFAQLEEVGKTVCAPAPICKKPLHSGTLPPKPNRPRTSSEEGLGSTERLLRETAEQVFAEQLAAWRVLEAEAMKHAKPDLELIAKPILERLERLDWAREVNIALDLDRLGNTLMLDVDLPEIEDFPLDSLAVDYAKLDLRIERLRGRKANTVYCQHVHGVLLRLISESFAAQGSINAVQARGYTQRSGVANGAPIDTYILSCSVQRNEWDLARFWQSECTQPIAALEQFDLRRADGRNGRLAVITPH